MPASIQQVLQTANAEANKIELAVQTIYTCDDKYICILYNPQAKTDADRMLMDNDILLDMDGNILRDSLYLHADYFGRMKRVWNINKDLKKSNYLEHYGRKGMKWYEHIFGEADSRAQYSKRGSVSDQSTVGMGMRFDRMKRAADYVHSKYGADQLLTRQRFVPEMDSVYGTDINPHGYQTNCQNVAVCAELQARGIDCIAREKHGPQTIPRLESMFKGGKEATQHFVTYNDDTPYYPGESTKQLRERAKNYLFDQPAGSRGIVLMHNIDGDTNWGHAVNYTIPEEGTYTLHDYQSLDPDYKGPGDLFDRANCYTILRTDNLEVDEDAVEDCFSDELADRLDVISPDWDDHMKHSDIYDALNAMDNGDSLEHYGRQGMKWYQHIYGEMDGRAKYFEKGVTKINRLSKKESDTAKKAVTQASKASRAQMKADRIRDKLIKFPGLDKLRTVIWREKARHYSKSAMKLNKKVQKIAKRRAKLISAVDKTLGLNTPQFSMRNPDAVAKKLEDELVKELARVSKIHNEPDVAKKMAMMTHSEIQDAMNRGLFQSMTTEAKDKSEKLMKEIQAGADFDGDDPNMKRISEESVRELMKQLQAGADFDGDAAQKRKAG